jgi:hypothetical protein
MKEISSFMKTPAVVLPDVFPLQHSQPIRSAAVQVPSVSPLEPVLVYHRLRISETYSDATLLEARTDHRLVEEETARVEEQHSPKLDWGTILLETERTDRVFEGPFPVVLPVRVVVVPRPTMAPVSVHCVATARRRAGSSDRSPNCSKRSLLVERWGLFEVLDVVERIRLRLPREARPDGLRELIQTSEAFGPVVTRGMIRVMMKIQWDVAR